MIQPASDPESTSRAHATVRRSPIAWVWRLIGLLMVGLAIAGAFLPLLPTTPFLLVAVFCFARSSPRLHHWLITHKRFGPMIADWNQHGALSRRVKIVSVSVMVATLALSAMLKVPAYVLIIQALVLCGSATFILTRPLPPKASDPS